MTTSDQSLSGEFALVPSCEIWSAMLVFNAPPVAALRAMLSMFAGPEMLRAAGPVPVVKKSTPWEPAPVTPSVWTSLTAFANSFAKVL